MPAPSSGSGNGLEAIESTAGGLVAGLPVAGSRLMSLMPLQKDPSTSHLPPLASVTKDGSIALKLSAEEVRNTWPSSVQWYRGLRGSSVGVVASAITELLEPKLEPA